jgi:hypothetical protein
LTVDFTNTNIDSNTLSLADATPPSKLDERQRLLLEAFEMRSLVEPELPTCASLQRLLPTLTQEYYDAQVKKNREFRVALDYIGLGRFLIEPSANNSPENLPVLTASQLRFINAILDPHETRKPQQVLKEMGLSSKTYQTWLKDKVFREYYHSRARTLLGEHIPEVKSSLLRKANTGDVNAIKLALEITGEWSDKPDKEFNPLWFVSQILDILQRNIRDTELLDAVAEDLQLLLQRMGVNPVINAAKPPVGVIEGAVTAKAAAGNNGEVQEPPLSQRTM